MCPYFGYSRGTPIDRHYLNLFLSGARSEIHGRTLEIGGTAANAERYGLIAVSEFVTVDVSADVSADLIADVQDPGVFAPGSFDSILAFFVLEHCEDPRKVVDNVHRWLKPGGRFFCVVPTAQRVHDAPRDYRRILPDALASLLSPFGDCQHEIYGNLATTLASLTGLAVEELQAALLEPSDPRYPVVACARARKGSER